MWPTTRGASRALVAVLVGCGSTAKTSATSNPCTESTCSDGGDAGAPPSGTACTEIGCSDGATIALDSPTGTWAPGGYAVQASGDGTMVSCTLNVPTGAANDVFGTCTPGSSLGPATLNLEFATRCVTIDAGTGVTGAQCTPIAGQSSLQLGVPGTPTSVTVLVERDGVQLANASVALQYMSVFPNGPACGGACQEASATLTVQGAASAATVASDGGTEAAGAQTDAAADAL